MDQLPPKWIDRLIGRLAPGHLVDEIRGDLHEMFAVDIVRAGIRRAKRQFVFNAIGFLIRSFFWKHSGQKNANSIFMTGNYFKMARRSLLANKGTTIINVVGLVIGITSALVIANVIRFEQSFDSFHSKKDDIYRVVRVTGSDKLEYRAGIVYPLADAMRTEIPGVEITEMEYLGASTVDVMSADGKTVNKFIEPGGVATIEPGFFKMFDFAGKPLSWIAGNPETALVEPSSLVITKEMAKKYFGDEDPLGQTLRFMKRFDFKVTGVIDDFPSNTDFPFKLMISYSSMETLFNSRLDEWVSVNDGHSVFVYSPTITKAELEARLDKIHASHVGKDIYDYRHYRLQEFNQLHYDPRFGNFSGRTITPETILALQIIVLFLLLAGCINYINLSTAQSTLRSKEIGLRKVLGSQHRHLIMQFLTETFVVVALAEVAAVTVVIAFTSKIKDLLNLQISFNLSDPFILLSLAIVAISVTLLSGLYPAFMISRFNPVATLRAKFSNEKVGGVNLRKMLVVAQFTITQILAVGTFIVISQMNYFQNVDMGFNRKAVIVNVSMLVAKDVQQRRATIAELKALPFVSGVSSSFTLPSGLERNRSSRSIGLPNAASAPDYESYEHSSIDENYLDLYQIKLLAGRNLAEGDTTLDNILINEVLMRRLGFTDPERAIGAEVKFGDGKRTRIAGIVDNYYSNSLKERVDYIAMVYRPAEYRWLSIRLDLNDDQPMADALAGIERIWNDHFPDVVFQYSFFDQNIKAFYQQEFKYSKLFQIFSLIFIGIGCLGLYGLITFIANKKGKEIAIRKTLGATISNIIMIFSKEYVVLIGVSFALALPVVWYGVNEWLSSFQNHIDLQWWMFAAPGMIVLAMALGVVGSKSFSAARANPVEKLKCE
jgi:ABC-type antimicrobial peptide transport system permease subunit